MAMHEELEAQVRSILADQWQHGDGLVVPEPSGIRLGNHARRLEKATVLYADIDGSTAMVQNYPWTFCAEVYKSFLHCASKIIKRNGGEITSYDGDRVMGVFIGERQNSRATLAGLQIHRAVVEIINPLIALQYQNRPFGLKHVVGIDTSEIYVAKTGVRGDNDLVWIGRAANYAAKLTSRSSDTPTWITKSVFDIISSDLKTHDGEDIWTSSPFDFIGNLPVYSSVWHFAIR